MPFVPKGKGLIISTLLKSPLGDLGAEINQILTIQELHHQVSLELVVAETQ